MLWRWITETWVCELLHPHVSVAAAQYLTMLREYSTLFRNILHLSSRMNDTSSTMPHNYDELLVHRCFCFIFRKVNFCAIFPQECCEPSRWSFASFRWTTSFPEQKLPGGSCPPSLLTCSPFILTINIFMKADSVKDKRQSGADAQGV